MLARMSQHAASDSFSSHKSCIPGMTRQTAERPFGFCPSHVLTSSKHSEHEIQNIHLSALPTLHSAASMVARPDQIIEPRKMADAETPTRQKSKRKRWTAVPDPEELAAEILDELQDSREGIDRKLANHNESFMQVQKKTRQQFIAKCEARIRALPDSVRSAVVATLLSSEDFAVEMNFSEIHTSSASTKSSLTWSCTDASLSDPSWRICEWSDMRFIWWLPNLALTMDPTTQCSNNMPKTLLNPRQP